MLRLAHAVGRVLKRRGAPHGADRQGHPHFRLHAGSALESGFNSAGVDVVLLGPLPTPGVAYLTRAQRASLGVVISASHNPFADNGIKFFSAQGTKLPDAWELAVEAALDEPRRCGWTRPAWARARRLDDAAGRYIEFCKSTFAQTSPQGPEDRGRRRHGAAYHIAPKVFHELGAEVIKPSAAARTA